MSIRIILGSSSEKVSKQLTQFLIENGYNVVGATSDAYEFLRRVHTVYPDLSIIDERMKGMNGHDLSDVLISEKICPVIAITSSSSIGDYVNLSQEPTFVPLVKPCNKQNLLNTVKLLVKTAKSINKLENEVHQLKKEKNQKVIISKAKKLLMENMSLTEEEAHRRIQKQSMDKGIAKVKIAEAIILMYE